MQDENKAPVVRRDIVEREKILTKEDTLIELIRAITYARFMPSEQIIDMIRKALAAYDQDKAFWDWTEQDIKKSKAAREQQS